MPWWHWNLGLNLELSWFLFGSHLARPDAPGLQVASQDGDSVQGLQNRGLAGCTAGRWRQASPQQGQRCVCWARDLRKTVALRTRMGKLQLDVQTMSSSVSLAPALVWGLLRVRGRGCGARLLHSFLWVCWAGDLHTTICLRVHACQLQGLSR